MTILNYEHKYTTTLVLLLVGSATTAGAFLSPIGSIRRSLSQIYATSNKEWSVADDWNRLSDENPNNSVPASEDIFNHDVAARVAFEMELGAPDISAEDLWLQEAVKHIQNENDDDDEDASTATTATDDLHTETFLDEMGREIALLVRCNESPQDMLIKAGRALPAVSDAERNHVSQLVSVNSEQGDWEATGFFRQAVTTIFQQHARQQQQNKHDNDSEELVMGPVEVAAWLQQSLDNDQAVGPHDGRVQATISRYGQYGTGYLTEGDFQKLYLMSVIGDCQDDRHLQSQRTKEIADVWRDLRNHGIESPVDAERTRQLEELQTKYDSQTDDRTMLHQETLLDECEIVEELGEISATTDREGKSSHKLVELASDSKTPVWMRDGDFVFIDEESCIGCMQCTSAAPSSFRMLENGRARTFCQRKGPDVATAVSACPVDCMHFVSFRELKEMETARDDGDGRDDHRHFGHSPTRGYIPRTPLHVSGMESDANHRSSFYHFLKSKCYKSPQCPQRGCYDCPMYKSDPESNPHFQKRVKEAMHIRAEHFKEHGIADPYRKTADL